MNPDPTTAPPPRQLSPTNQTLKGIAIGVGASAALAGIILAAFLLRKNMDTTSPPEQDQVSSSPLGTGDAERAHAQDLPIEPETAARVAELEMTLKNNPTDLNARKQLAVLLVEGGQFMPAYRQAEAIMDADPGDPDGLYVLGVVRLRMGQTKMAIDVLDQLLAEYPSHVGGLLARGMAFLRAGNAAAAVQTWERGLASAGGKHPELERLLRVSQVAREGSTKPVSTASATESSDPLRAFLAIANESGKSSGNN